MVQPAVRERQSAATAAGRRREMGVHWLSVGSAEPAQTRTFPPPHPLGFSRVTTLELAGAPQPSVYKAPTSPKRKFRTASRRQPAHSSRATPSFPFPAISVGGGRSRIMAKASDNGNRRGHAKPSDPVNQDQPPSRCRLINPR
jgi:hypothetical protein